MYGFNPYVRLDFLIYAIIPVRGIWKLIVCDEPRIGRQLNEKVKLVKNGINQQLFIKTLMIRFLNNIGHFALSRYYISNNKLSEWTL